MADDDRPDSPPISVPKASYNFDDLDFENMDPFKSGTKIASSPPISSVNPFQAKKTLANSPTNVPDDPLKSKNRLSHSPTPESDSQNDVIDPFKSTKRLSNSPPPSELSSEDIISFKPRIADEREEMDMSIDDPDPFVTRSNLSNPPTNVIKDSERSQPPNLDINDNNQKNVQEKGQGDATDLSQESVGKENKPVKKKNPAKKIEATSRIKFDKSKFKKPAAPSDDIAIFAPPAGKTNEVLNGVGGNNRSDAIDDVDGKFVDAAEVQTNDAIQDDVDEDEFHPASDSKRVFNDPQAWDMLEKLGSGAGTDNATDLARQSLYVKFDPLVNRNNTAADLLAKHNAVAPAKKVPQLDSVQESDDLLMMNTPPKSKPAAKTLSQSLKADEDVNKLFSTTPTGLDRTVRADSGLPDSGSPVHKPLVSSSGDDGIVQVLKFSDDDVKQMEMDFQGRLLQKEREWDQKFQDLQKENKELKDKNSELKRSNEHMRKIVADYEETISQVIADKENSKATTCKSVQELETERDAALEGLQSMETAFSDLLKRYEKTKDVIENFKKNEETLRKCVSDYQAKLKKQEGRYSQLKTQAEEKIANANDEMEKLSKLKAAEIARLQAAVKKSEIQCSSLETSLQQKIKETEELTAICDDLISRVGPGS